jgi:hypothetical protein
MSPNAALNDLLIQVYRSLLQYAVECWPWADADEAPARNVVEELAHEQQAQASTIADLLDHRGWPVDFGTYPDWSELHYVSLDYLLMKIVADEEQLLSAIERARPSFDGDNEARTLATQLLEAERRRLARLREIWAARKAVVPA